MRKEIFVLAIFILLLGNLQAKTLADVDVKKESSSFLFENISGWISKGLFIKKRVNLNQELSRSPDPLEFRNLESNFVINYNFFIKDPEYKCRRPTYYKYFSTLFEISPFQDFNCNINYQINLTSKSGNISPLSLRDLDPSRIYQIHYLFAGKGTQMMSRWGHAMFRLVICAPERKPGPLCLQDYAHHVVVTYRANIEDEKINYLDGIKGVYPSQLFLISMSEVVAEYTKGESRDVISLPIKMNPEEIARFTDRLLETYWGYKGQYYFFTNNCATEAMNHLRIAFPANKQIQKKNILSPVGLYKYLIKNKLVDITLLFDEKKAIDKGYLFPGITTHLEKSLSLFANEENKILSKTFLSDFTPEERKKLYEEKLIKEKENSVTILANALRIEDQILLSKEEQFSKKISNAIWSPSPILDFKGNDFLEKLKEVKELTKQLNSENYLKEGYGIPLRGEFVLSEKNNNESIKKEIEQLLFELRQRAASFLIAEADEIKNIKSNRKWIIQQIKEFRK